MRFIAWHTNQRATVEMRFIASITKEIKKANKSERWMPRLWEAMKDVISCDKLREGANNH
jgi:hypothetical protein